MPGAPNEREKMGWKTRRVMPALKKLYPPDGKAPTGVPTKAVLDKVIKELASDSSNEGLVDPSPDTIDRAMGRRS